MKKTLALLLSLCLLVSLLPVSAMAAETTYSDDVSTYAALKTGVESTSTTVNLKLVDDIAFATGETFLTIGKGNTVNIDLNGHEINGMGNRVFHVTNGTLNLTGTGTVTGGVVNDDGSSVIRVGNSNGDEAATALTIGSGVTVSTKYCYGVSIFGTNTGGQSLTVDGTVSVSGPSAAISGNGSSNFKETNITINDGAVVKNTSTSGEIPAIYHPQAGTLTINGGTISGPSGIEAKSGNTNIVINGNPTITATAAAPTHVASSNGPSTGGYAIAAVRTTGGYPGSPAFDIQSGTFTGPVAIVTDNEPASGRKAEIKISGGTFSGAVSSDNENGTIEITGGTFAEKPDDKFLTRGNAFVEGEGGYTVALATYTITYYDADDSELTALGRTFTKAELPIEPLAEAPVKPGYTFNGWYSTWARNTAATTRIPVDTTWNINLYGKWTANEYTLTFNVDGEKYEAYTVACDTALTTVLPANPTKANQKFAGWASLPDKMPAEDLTVNATWADKTYTVKFDPNGGEGTMADEPFAFGVTQALTKNAFTRKGYHFDGWATEKDGEVVHADGEKVTNLTDVDDGEVTLYAVWSELNTVNFYMSDSETVPYYSVQIPQKTALGEKMPADPTLDGYTFTGWKTKSGTSVDAEHVIKNGGNLYAQWAVDTYTQTVNYNDGVRENVEYEREFGKTWTPKPAKNDVCPDYAFVSWTVKYGDTEEEFTGGEFTMPASNVEFKANWRLMGYTVEFNANVPEGESVTGEMEPQDFKLTETKALTSNEFGRAGYTFAGWAKTAGATSRDYDDAANVSKLGADGATVTLYAVWTPNKYTVTFHTNYPADLEMTDKAAGPINTQTDYGAKFPSFTNPALAFDEAPAGYTFVGWTLGEDGETVYNAGELQTLLAPEDGGAYELYAKWRDAAYKIFFHTDAAFSSYEIYAEVGYKEALPEMPAAAMPEVPEGQIFLGYYNAVEDGGTYKAGNEQFYDAEGKPVADKLWDYPVNGSLIAKFDDLFTINYEANAPEGTTATGTMEPDIVGKHETVKLSPNQFKIAGYEFQGWTAKKNDTTSLKQDEWEFVPSSYTSNNPVTFYAVWEGIEYTLTAKNSDGSLIGTSTNKCGDPVPFSGLVDETGGKTFSGWYSEYYKQSFKAGNDYIMPPEDDTVTAVWDAATFEIKFDAGEGMIGGAKTSTVTYTYGDSISEFPDASREGYDLVGWTVDGDATKTLYNEGKPYTVSAAATLKAAWVKSELAMTAANLEDKPTETDKRDPLYDSYSVSVADKEITVSATNLVKHYAGDGQFAYWLGIGVEEIDGYKYQWSFKEITETNFEEGKGQVSKQKVGETTYVTGYFGSNSGAAFTDSDKVAYLGVKDNFGKLTVYTVKFDVTLKNYKAEAVADSYGNTVKLNDAAVVTGVEGTEITVEPVLADGFENAKIYYTKGDSEEKTYPEGTSIELPNADIKVGIEVTPIEYTISYELYGGTNAAKNPVKVTAEDTFPITLEVPEIRTGYAFKGWYNAAPAFTDDHLVTAISGIGDQTFYARWNKEWYNVTLNVNGGTYAEGVDPAAKYEYDTEYTLPTATQISREGFTFAGWYDNDAFTGTAVTTIPAGTTGDKTFYAKWDNVLVDSFTVELETLDKEGKATTGALVYGDGGSVRAKLMTEDGTAAYVPDTETYDVTYAWTKGSEKIDNGEDPAVVVIAADQDAAAYTYVCTVTVSHKENKAAKSEATKSVNVTIGPRSFQKYADEFVVAFADQSKTEFDFTGSAIQPAVKVLWKGTALKASDFEVTYVDPVDGAGTAINVGTAKASVAGVVNFTDSLELSYTIKPIDFKFTVTPVSGLIYNQTAQNLVTVTPALDEIEAAGCTLNFVVNRQPAEGIPTGTDAGTYTITYTLDGGNNYNDAAEAAVVVNIAQKPITIKWTGVDGSTTNFDFPYKETENQGPKYDDYDGLIDGDELAIRVDNATNRKTGSYTAEVLSLGNTNYTATNPKCAYRIIPGTSTVKVEAKTGLIYNGADQELVTVTEKDGCTLVFTVDGKTLADNEIPTGKNADTYKNISYKIIPSADYSHPQANTAISVGDVTIAQKEIELVWGAAELTYNVAEQAPTVEVKAGLVSGDTVTLEVTGKQTNAGNDYTATAEITDNSNYVIKSGDETKSFQILPKNISDAADKTISAALNYSVTSYNGTAKEPRPVIKYTPAGAETATDLVNGVDYTFEREEAINAKTGYKVTVNATGNYTGTREFTFDIQPAALKRVDLSETTAVYTGAVQTPTITVVADLQNIEDEQTVAEAEYEVKWTKKGDTADATLKDAGTYVVTVTPKADGNFAGEAVTAEYTITKAPLDVKVTLPDPTIYYGADPAEIPASAYTISYEGFVGEDNASAVTGTAVYTHDYTPDKNAGDYYFHTSGLTSNNYELNFVKDANAKISVLTVAPKPLTLEWSTEALTYNGEEQAPTATLSGTVNNDEITVEVTGKETNAGTGYTATATLSGEKLSNYVLPNNLTRTFDIAALTVELAWTNTEFVYNGENQVPTATVANLVEGDDCTIRVSAVDGHSSNLTEVESINADTYSARAMELIGEDSANYALSKQPNALRQEFTIAQAVIRTLTLKDAEGNVVESVVYNGEDQTPKYFVEYLTEAGAWKTVPKDQYNVTWTTAGTPVATPLINAGEYTATVAAIADGNFTNSTPAASATFTIEPKSLADAVVTPDATPLTYNGENQTPKSTIITLDGKEIAWDGGNNYSFTYLDKNGEEVNPKDAGTYTLVVTGKGNYTGTNNTATFTIAPKPVVLEWSNTTKEYNGQEQVPTATATGLIGTDTCEVTVEGAQTAAGSYTATVAALSNPNYTLPAEGQTHEWTIEAKPITPVWAPDPLTFTYDGTTKEPTITFNGVIEGEEVYARYAMTDGEGNGVAIENEVYQAIDAGTYQVTIVGLSDSNYKLAENSVTTGVMTIKQRELTLTWAEDGLEFTYDGTPKEPTIVVTGAVAGDVFKPYHSMTFGPENKPVEVKDEVYQAIDAGTYHVKVYDFENPNYKLAEGSETEKDMVILPREVEVVWSNTELTYNGEEQAPTAEVYTIGDDTCEVTVQGAETNAGTNYTATATALSNGNYKLPEPKPTTTFTIAPKAITVTLIGEYVSETYDGNEHTAKDFEIVTDEAGYTIDDIVYDVDKYTITETNAGYYDVVGASDTDFTNNDPNYAVTFEVESYPTLIIMPGLVEVEFEPYDPTNYDGADHTPTIKSITFNGQEVTIPGIEKSIHTVIVDKEDDSVEPLDEAPTYVGHYATFVFFFDENSNYTTLNIEELLKEYSDEDVQEEMDTHDYPDDPTDIDILKSIVPTIEYEITPKAVTVKADNKTMTYQGTEPELTATVTGTIGEDKVTYTISRAEGNDAGTYTITPAGEAEQGNYTVTYETGTLTIEPAKVEFTVSIKGWTAGNTPNKPTTTLAGELSDEDVTFTYAKKGTTSFSADVPTTAGDYTVKAELKENKNFVAEKAATADFTIGSSGGGSFPSGGSTGGGSSSTTKYTVTLATADHGTVAFNTPSSSTATASVDGGDTIKIAVTPAAHYKVNSVAYTTATNTTPVEIAADTNGLYSFTMPKGNVTVTATFVPENDNDPSVGKGIISGYSTGYQGCTGYNCVLLKFSDLDPAAWYHDGIHFCLENGIMQGFGNDKFQPLGLTTRAQVVTTLWNIAGHPISASPITFKDVNPDDWFYDAIMWAAGNGIVNGYGDGTFGPNDMVTREQIAKIFYGYALFYDFDVSATSDLAGYEGVDEISAWALPYVKWAVGAGVCCGAEGNHKVLAPSQNAGRAELATMILNFCMNVARK